MAKENPQNPPFVSNVRPAAENAASKTPTDMDIKAALEKAAADLGGLSLTSNSVCLLATVRLLKSHFGLADAQRAMEWLANYGHGLGCNASQLGAWATREPKRGGGKSSVAV